MKRLRWKDIPIDVLESVYKKWEAIRKLDYRHDYWIKCRLCNYCENKMVFGCDVCPAVSKRWCYKGKSNYSRLHKDYHYSESYIRAQQSWKEEITKFLKFLRRHIKNRKGR